MLSLLPTSARFRPNGLAKLRATSLLALGVFSLCPAQAQEANPQAPPPATAPDVTTSSVPLSGPIRRQDVLRVVISGTDLGGVVRVDSDGTISLPRLGQINVVQKKATEAAQTIAKRAEDRKLLIKADVAVYIVGRKPEEVTIYGAVTTPGRQALREDMVLSDAIETSAPQPNADFSRVVITRRAEVSPNAKPDDPTPPPTEIVVDYRQYRTGASREPQYNPVLKDGDRVFLYQFTPTTQGTVRVSGEIKDPSKSIVSVAQGDTAFQVLQSVGGLGDYANHDQILVVRQGAEGKQERLPVAYDAILRGDRSKDVVLQRGDEIVVPKSDRIRQITVTGAVREARPILYREGITLQEAIANSGGLTEGARQKDISVRRTVAGGKLETLKYDLTKDADAATIMQDGDNIEVPYPSRRQRPDIGTILGALGGLAYLLSQLRR